jgi:hypothetical protein
MQPNRRIVHGDPLSASQLADGAAVEIDASQSASIAGLQLIHQARDAQASLEVRLGLDMDVCLATEDLEGARLDSTAPPEIDQGVCQESVKPRDDALVPSQRGALLDAAHEGCLQNVLRELPRTEARFEKREKLRPDAQQLFHGVARRQWGRQRRNHPIRIRAPSSS